MNIFTLHDLTSTKNRAVEFLQQKGILHASRYCNNGHEMSLSLTDKEDRWRCRKKGCEQQIQLKAGTWIQGSHLSYSQVVKFIYPWCMDYTTVKFAYKELDIVSCETTVDWNNYMSLC